MAVATTVFAIVGNIWGGPAGGAIGAMLGAYLDNEYLSRDNRDRGRSILPDLQSVVEGGPSIHLAGRECRVPGQVVFQSAPFEISAGVFAVDVAVVVADHAISSVDRIFAEGFDIYNRVGVRSSGVQTGVFSMESFGQVGPGLYMGMIHSPESGYDLTQLRVWPGGAVPPPTGVHLSMSGWFDARNNRPGSPPTKQPANAIEKGKDLGGATWLRIFGTSPDGEFAAESASTQAVVLTQSFAPLDTAFASALETRHGTPAQTVLTILRKRDPSRPIAFEGSSLFGLQDFRLTQFGNRLPELFAVVDESGVQLEVADVVDKIFERSPAGWAQGSKLSWDTTGLDKGKVCHGYTMGGQLSPYERLEPLVYAYDMAYQVRDGTVYVFHPENAREWVVPESDWGCTETPGPALQFSQVAEAKLPSKVTVRYVDRNANFEEAAVERHRSSPANETGGPVELDLRDLTMTEDQAVEAADLLLWRGHRESRKFKGSLPPRWYVLAENDVIRTTFNGRSIQLFVTKRARGANREIRVEGHVYEQDPPNR